jgi:signal transduction histidine kinase
MAISLGGWLAAAGGAAVALAVSRLLAARMEAVARACHELRGPLAAARLGLQVGIRGEELPPARLRAIDLELSRATLALDDLLAARSGGPPRRVAERVDVRQLLVDSVEAWEAAAAARGVRLARTWSGPPAHVWGERIRLAQATGNLIANAIEHGAGTVEVKGRAGTARVRIEVSDEGAGLPAPVAQLARRSHRGDARRGRGLAIASRIAADHGGCLASAPVQRGARLVLELPPAGDQPARPLTAG